MVTQPETTHPATIHPATVRLSSQTIGRIANMVIRRMNCQHGFDYSTDGDGTLKTCRDCGYEEEVQ